MINSDDVIECIREMTTFKGNEKKQRDMTTTKALIASAIICDLTRIFYDCVQAEVSSLVDFIKRNGRKRKNDD